MILQRPVIVGQRQRTVLKVSANARRDVRVAFVKSNSSTVEDRCAPQAALRLIGNPPAPRALLGRADRATSPLLLRARAAPGRCAPLRQRPSGWVHAIETHRAAAGRAALLYYGRRSSQRAVLTANSQRGARRAPRRPRPHPICPPGASRTRLSCRCPSRHLFASPRPTAPAASAA